MTKKLTFNGIVQGIGFRPTARRIAIDLGITGQVKNSGGNVKIIIQGNEQALEEFIQRLVALFEIKSYQQEIIDNNNTNTYSGFEIVHSDRDAQTPFITPDLATCKDCERELTDKNNRRYNHPFISCINCGPRYTIINTLPYDRENITMSAFEMCNDCSKEYTAVRDRRSHAQTIACNHCGPETNMPIQNAVDILRAGRVLAIKGIGGYHLACKADCVDAVNEIRKAERKSPLPLCSRLLMRLKNIAG